MVQGEQTRRSRETWPPGRVPSLAKPEPPDDRPNAVVYCEKQAGKEGRKSRTVLSFKEGNSSRESSVRVGDLETRLGAQKGSKGGMKQWREGKSAEDKGKAPASEHRLSVMGPSDWLGRLTDASGYRFKVSVYAPTRSHSLSAPTSLHLCHFLLPSSVLRPNKMAQTSSRPRLDSSLPTLADVMLSDTRVLPENKGERAVGITLRDFPFL